LVRSPEQCSEAGSRLGINADSDSRCDFDIFGVSSQLFERRAKGFFQACQSLIAVRRRGHEDHHELVPPIAGDQILFTNVGEQAFCHVFQYGIASSVSKNVIDGFESIQV
jgi:hypothetical protein